MLMCFVEEDEGHQADRLAAAVGNAVIAAGAGVEHVARAEGDRGSVVVCLGLALKEEEDFGLVLVLMGTDGAAGLQGDLAEEAALAHQLLLSEDFCELDSAVAVPHVFPSLYRHVLVFAYHGNQSFLWGILPLL